MRTSSDHAHRPVPVRAEIVILRSSGHVWANVRAWISTLAGAVRAAHRAGVPF